MHTSHDLSVECFLLFLLCCLAQLDLCQSRPVPQYKNFQIEVSSQGYRLFGTETFRTSLKELLEHLQGQSLRTENLRFQLRRCCPPQPRGITYPHLISVTQHLYSQEHSGTLTAVKPDDLYSGGYGIADEKALAMGTCKGQNEWLHIYNNTFNICLMYNNWCKSSVFIATLLVNDYIFYNMSGGTACFVKWRRYMQAHWKSGWVKDDLCPYFCWWCIKISCESSGVHVSLQPQELFAYTADGGHSSKTLCFFGNTVTNNVAKAAVWVRRVFFHRKMCYNCFTS